MKISCGQCGVELGAVPTGNPCFLGVDRFLVCSCLIMVMNSEWNSVGLCDNTNVESTILLPNPAGHVSRRVDCSREHRYFIDLNSTPSVHSL